MDCHRARATRRRRLSPPGLFAPVPPTQRRSISGFTNSLQAPRASLTLTTLSHDLAVRWSSSRWWGWQEATCAGPSRCYSLDAGAIWNLRQIDMGSTQSEGLGGGFPAPIHTVTPGISGRAVEHVPTYNLNMGSVGAGLGASPVLPHPHTHTAPLC